MFRKKKQKRTQEQDRIKQETDNLINFNRKLKLNSSIIRYGNSSNLSKTLDLEDEIVNLTNEYYNLLDEICNAKNKIAKLNERTIKIYDEHKKMNEKTSNMFSNAYDSVKKIQNEIDTLVKRRDFIISDNKRLVCVNNDLKRTNSELLMLNGKRHDKYIRLLEYMAVLNENNQMLEDKVREKETTIRTLSGKESLIKLNQKKYNDIYMRINEGERKLKEILDLKNEVTSRINKILD